MAYGHTAQYDCVAPDPNVVSDGRSGLAGLPGLPGDDAPTRFRIGGGVRRDMLRRVFDGADANSGSYGTEFTDAARCDLRMGAYVRVVADCHLGCDNRVCANTDRMAQCRFDTNMSAIYSGPSVCAKPSVFENQQYKPAQGSHYKECNRLREHRNRFQYSL